MVQSCLCCPKGHRYESETKGKARRKRETTRSRPNATIVSKSGGATARPTMATRVALINRPALTFSIRSNPRKADRKHHGSTREKPPAHHQLLQQIRTFASFQNLSRASCSYAKSSVKKARAQPLKSFKKRVRGRKKSTARANQSSLAAIPLWLQIPFCQLRPHIGQQFFNRHFLRYCVLNHSSLARSKTALVRLTPTSENRSNQFRSRQIFGIIASDQPRSARKFRNASGRNPSSV